jgi:SH3-like domain-containing protein
MAARGRALLGVVLAVASVAPLLGPVAALAVAPGPGTATDDVDVLAEPDDEADILLLLPANATVEIDGKPEAGYYPVVVGRLEGWVATGALASVVEDDADREDQDEDAGDAEIDVTVVAAADVDLLEDPDEDADSVLEVAEGGAVEPTGDHEDGFVEVEVDGETGWVPGEDLTLDEDPSADADEGDEGREAREPRAERERRAERVPRAERVGRAERRSPQASNIPEPPRNAPNYSKAELIRIIEEAADYYDQPREDMLRVARCESELTPTAVNPRTGDSGLFQFNPDTWQTTPYRRYSIFDPRASAFAAGWMWSVGRRNEWVCQ